MCLFFAVWAGERVLFFGVWAGGVFFFCCLGGGRVFVFAVWAGGIFFFAVWAGERVFLLFGRRRVFVFAVWAGGVFFFVAVWAGDGSSLTYRSAWLVFKRPNNKKDQTAKTKKKRVPSITPYNPSVTSPCNAHIIPDILVLGRG